MVQYFSSMAKDKRDKILKTKLLIYVCEGTETEIKEWFKTINIVGVPLKDQELLNAIYSGEFVTKAKAEFSNNGNANVQKWSAYISGKVSRQDFLERALEWVSKGNIEKYMGSHRTDKDIDELKNYFNSVIDWVSAVFIDVKGEMCGLEWGRLYEAYHSKSYNPKEISAKVQKLYADSYITSYKGVFEFVLGGSKDTKLLNVRVFDEATKKSVYASQTKTAKAKKKSNCPLCAAGHEANKNRIWNLPEMDADHVRAWSKDGATNARNCQMLCRTHNQAKGNK